MQKQKKFAEEEKEKEKNSIENKLEKIIIII